MPDSNLGALTALCRLRRVETDAARRHLGEAVSRETTLAAQDAGLVGELDAARQITGDFDREAFVAWVNRIREKRANLANVMRDAAAQVTAARTALAHRRVAQSAAEDALAAALAARQAVVANREQVMLEDIARVLKRAADDQ